jgi:hypothetical protein
MSPDNVTPIRSQTAEKPRRPRRKREPPPANTFDMPDTLRLVCALQGVCAGLERLLQHEDQDLEAHQGMASAAAILSAMVRESLTNQRLI